MSSKSSLLSFGVLALALLTLQGCAASTVTRSSALEPGASVAPSVSLPGDHAARSASRQASESPAAERSHARQAEHRAARYDVCRRCK